MLTTLNTLPVLIYGREEQAKIGAVVRPDGWKFPGKLIDSHFGLSPYDLTTSRYWSEPEDSPLIRQLPVNIEITGRTIQKDSGRLAVRCKIEVLHDGEPNTIMGGWLYI